MTPAKSIISPVTVLLNHRAGNTKGNGIKPQLEELLTQSGIPFQVLTLPRASAISSFCDSVVQETKAKGGVIVAAGGDGTINAVAGLCYKHGVPMGVIPLGTFNYFARALGIPLVLEEAVANLRDGILTSVSAGKVGDYLFLNNASFGHYTKIILRREQASLRYGRWRIVAALSAIRSLFLPHRLFNITLSDDEKTAQHTTSMVFIGNNPLQLQNLGLDRAAQCTASRQLALVMLKQPSRFATARILWRGLMKDLNHEPALETLCAKQFTVESRRLRINLVIDGEILRAYTPLQFDVIDNALQVIAPTPEAPIEGDS